MNHFLSTLRNYWGYDSFRPGQAQIVQDIFHGHDVLALMPTGGGKSICFQVPGLMREGITVVISPLIALMQDQVQALKSKGIKAVALTSGMHFRELDILLDNAKFGAYQFLYTSPERIQSALFIERFKQMKVGLIVVDEAHCISEWGHDFRPSFMAIKNLRTWHPSTPVVALTATATDRTQKEIVERLMLRSPKIHQSPFERPNLIYHSVLSDNKTQHVIDWCKNYGSKTGIVYCQTRKSVKLIASLLLKNKVSVGIYHGGMNKEERKKMLTEWLNDQRKIMVATNAFGMGIDKPNVRFVIHYEFPNSLEAYFQEAGRGGRDGQNALAINYWQHQDIQLLDYQMEAKYPPIEEIKKVYRALCNYLKIAIGSGQGESYPFELEKFCKLFDIKPILCYNALKVLEMMNEITFDENVFQPTKVKFAVGPKALYNFQIQHEQIYPLTLLLTRTYPGVFALFCELEEKEFCRQLKISPQQLTQQLKYIEQAGIIDVEWKNECPTITFVKARMPYDDLAINQQKYVQRKQIAHEKLTAVKEYLNTQRCRAQLLINYFGLQSTPCQQCDNCIKKQNETNFKQDTNNILTLLTQKPQTNAQLKALFVDSNQYKAIIRQLILDGTIAFDGQYYKRTN